MHEKIGHIDPKKGHPGLSILSILFDAKIKPQFTTLLRKVIPREKVFFLLLNFRSDFTSKL